MLHGVHASRSRDARASESQWLLIVGVMLVGACLGGFVLFSDELEAFFIRMYGWLD